VEKLRLKLGIRSKTLFKVLIGIVAVVLVVLAVVYINVLRSEPAFLVIAGDSDEEQPAPATTAAPALPGTIVVYVSGHVRSPGVFEFDEGARIWEALEAAGGMTAYADKNAINLADFLVDAQHVIVFGIDDNMPPSVLQGDAPDAGMTAGGLVNINTATHAQLQTLSGIGEARARDIISHRQARGGFATIEEIMNVPGIGEGIFARIRDFITVD